MKIPYATLALLTGASVVCSSCFAPDTGYVSYAAPGGVSAGAAWTNASYDANGFPIFGYSYGRPVYGYTSTGTAIFTIAALTALCYVPHWKPASWYRGPYYYPRGIHRVSAPPVFPRGHHPGLRPQGGIQPPPPNGAHPPVPGRVPSPIPSSPAVHGPGPAPAFSTMPAPRGVRVAPTPGAVAPGASGVGVPKPVSPGAASPKPAFSTMPAPNPGGLNPGVVKAGGMGIPKPASPSVGAPKISTMPASGGFSIPKPTESPDPTAVHVGAPAVPSGGASPAPAPAIRTGAPPTPRGAH